MICLARQHHLAGQGPKQHCTGKNWIHQHVHAAEAETYALARPRCVHGRRADPQRPPLWRTCAGKTSHRQTTAAIQRCVQEGPKSLEHRPEQLGSNSPQTVTLETDCSERSLQLRRDARSATQRRENEKTDHAASDFVSPATGTVMPALDWLATPDVVPE